MHLTRRRRGAAMLAFAWFLAFGPTGARGESGRSAVHEGERTPAVSRLDRAPNAPAKGLTPPEAPPPRMPATPRILRHPADPPPSRLDPPRLDPPRDGQPCGRPHPADAQQKR